MKLVFMGTPAFALPTLEALHATGHNIIAVYTQPPRPANRGQKETPSPVHEFALANGLNVFTPTSLKDKDAQDNFAAHQAEIAIVVAYGLLLPKAILEAYPLGCINVHPSLLPRWRGAAPIQRTIMVGDKETGICIMQMSEGLDTGDVLLVKRHAIAPGTTSGMLHDTLAQKAAPMVLEVLDGLKNGSIKAVKQSEAGATYAKKITKDECRIAWSEPAEALYHRILGLNPLPGAFFDFGNEIIKVFGADVENGGTQSPGTVLDDRLLIQCGNGALRLTQLQRPGKKKMSAEELLRGFSIATGAILD